MALAILMTLVGLLFLVIISDGVTARKVLLGLVGLVLLGVFASNHLGLSILMTLAGFLLFGVITNGVTARKVLLAVVGFVLLGVSALGGLISAFGYEAVSTGSNPGGWWSIFLTLDIAPLLGFARIIGTLFSRS